MIFETNAAISRLKYALDVCDNLHNRISKNIANEYKVGYKKLDSDFKNYVDTNRSDPNFQKPEVSAGGSMKSLSKPGIEVKDLMASSSQEVPEQGSSSLDIEEEMVNLAQNSLLYKAVAQTLAMNYSLLKTSITEGRHQA